MVYYAVNEGHTTGLFTNWADCKRSVNGFFGSKYKKFENKTDAIAYMANYQIEKSKKKQFEPDITVYTDGACTKNGSKNARAGIGIYFGEDDPRNVSRSVVGKQTNNCAELLAIMETYKILKDDIESGKNVLIVTDSTYSVKCCTTYGLRMNRKNWTENIPNKEMVREAFHMFDKKKNIKFLHVRSHTGEDDPHSRGNEEADRLANLAIGRDVTKIPDKTISFQSKPIVSKQMVSNPTVPKSSESMGSKSTGSKSGGSKSTGSNSEGSNESRSDSSEKDNFISYTFGSNKISSVLNKYKGVRDTDKEFKDLLKKKFFGNRD